MKGHKNYLQPIEMVLGSLHDLAGLQKAETVMADTTRGVVKLRIAVYEDAREYTFTVEDIGGRRCQVQIELEGEGLETERLIDHEFALLDYVLTDEAKVEILRMEEWDRQFDEERSANPNTGGVNGVNGGN